MGAAAPPSPTLAPRSATYSALAPPNMAEEHAVQLIGLALLGEDRNILIVKQKVSAARGFSLRAVPGAK